MGLTEDSQADVDRHVDQGATVAAGRRGLGALGRAKGTNTTINGHTDQAIGGGLLLARNASKDGRAETKRHVNQALGSLDSLHKAITG